MNLNNVAIGASQGISLVDKRKETEQRLQQQQETHRASMAQKEQVQSQNDIKLEQQQLALDETKRALFRRDTDEALDSWASTGDATLFKNLRTDESFTKMYGDIADIQTAAEVDPGELADQILLESGVSTTDIDKMTPEDKTKVVKAAGEHIMILTKADGSKHTTSLEELSAMSGRTSRADKVKRDIYAKVVAAGGTKRALALAEVRGDEKEVKRLTEALKLIGDNTPSKTSSKDPGFVTKAKYMVKADGGDPEDEQLVANKVAEIEASTAKSKNMSLESNKRAQAIEKSTDILAAETPEQLQATLNTPSTVAVRTLEAKALKDDPIFKESTRSFMGTVQSITGFQRVVSGIKEAGITANMGTKLKDWGEAMVNDKADNKFWSSNPSLKEQYSSNMASQVSKRFANDQQLQLATVALIKSMSGLAVTNEEREMYMQMLGAGKTQATRKVLVAAQTFINSQKSVLDTFTSMLSNAYPVTGAMLKQQVKFAVTPSAKESKANAKYNEQQAAERKKRQKDLMSAAIEKLGK